MLVENKRGNFSFLKGIAPYSAGVVAEARFEVVWTDDGWKTTNKESSRGLGCVGFSADVKDYDIRVENPKLGAGVY